VTVFINGGWRNDYGFCVDVGKRHTVLTMHKNNLLLQKIIEFWL
jgi:hypothetical protein